MWYFTWILGLLLACACGIINVMWLEATGCLLDDVQAKDTQDSHDNVD